MPKFSRQTCTKSERRGSTDLLAGCKEIGKRCVRGLGETGVEQLREEKEKGYMYKEEEWDRHPAHVKFPLTF